MAIFNNLFTKDTEEESITPQHSVIIKFDYGMESLDPLFELEDKLEIIIEEAEAGELDGHEIAMDGSDGFLYMYGPNAEVLFKTIKPVLDEAAFIKGGVATLRFGPPEDGAHEIDIDL